MIGPEGIKMEEKKVKGVLDWLILKYIKNVQKFLGLANYYYQFIKDFVSITRCQAQFTLGWKSAEWTQR